MYQTIPTYSWFLLQYCSIHQIVSTMFHHTRKFKVWCVVKGRGFFGFFLFFFRKSKPDANYANAVYKFWRNVPLKIAKMWLFFSADEKCKVPVGEPGYPITTLIRAKESYFWYKWKVYGHKPYFSRLPFIPDSY